MAGKNSPDFRGRRVCGNMAGASCPHLWITCGWEFRPLWTTFSLRDPGAQGSWLARDGRGPAGLSENPTRVVACPGFIHREIHSVNNFNCVTYPPASARAGPGKGERDTFPARCFISYQHCGKTCPQLWIGKSRLLAGQRAQTPELPRRWLPSRCVSTMPMASIRAYMVVGPTKVNPRSRNAFESAMDSAEKVGI